MSDFLMPSMGAEMEEGTLVEWLIKPGDRVSRGQVIAVIETAKGAIDVEVFESGTVEEIYIAEGTKVPVGTPLARIGEGQHVVADSELRREAEPEQEPEPKRGPEPQREADPERETGRERAAERTGPPPASPAARRRAREAGIDLATLAGSGAQGAIVLADVEAAASKEEHPAARKESEPTRAGFDREEMRRAIAGAMSRSKREIPHYYLATTVDLRATMDWLDQWNAGRPPAERILVSALFIKATALALERHGELNGHYGDDGFRPADEINPGMAIHLRGGGLVAPAILGANELTVAELMQRLQDLVTRARGGGLRGSELSLATATVTALGERGVDSVWGVIHPPQVAMVGFGRARQRAVVVADGVAAHPAVDISLAADHRVCDGHLGALFLNEIDELLQQPEVL